MCKGKLVGYLMAKMEEETGVGHVASLAVKVKKSQKLFLIWPHRPKVGAKSLTLTVKTRVIVICFDF